MSCDTCDKVLAFCRMRRWALWRTVCRREQMLLGDVKRCTLVVKLIIDLQHLLAPEPVENLRLVCGVGVSLAQVTWRTTYCKWPLISSGSWIEMHAHIVSYMYSICTVYVYTYAHHSHGNTSQVLVFPLSHVCHHPLLSNLLWHTKVQAAAYASLMKVAEGVGRRSTRGFLKLMDFGERKGYMVTLG